ncbi:MAG TPA: hypothetical protein VHB54_22045 [Mucilaginibacter sp.]|nr:hypothetical protein [Mucilaginibacter sp.]
MAEKFRVMFGGVAFSNFGGVRSLGPPWGFCMLAQPKRKAVRANANKILTKKADFLFDPIFSLYNRFFPFYEDYHSALKIIDLKPNKKDAFLLM